MNRFVERYVQSITRSYVCSGALRAGLFRPCLIEEKDDVLGCNRYRPYNRMVIRNKILLSSILILGLILSSASLANGLTETPSYTLSSKPSQSELKLQTQSVGAFESLQMLGLITTLDIEIEDQSQANIVSGNVNLPVLGYPSNIPEELQNTAIESSFFVHVDNSFFAGIVVNVSKDKAFRVGYRLRNSSSVSKIHFLEIDEQNAIRYLGSDDNSMLDESSLKWSPISFSGKVAIIVQAQAELIEDQLSIEMPMLSVIEVSDDKTSFKALPLSQTIPSSNQKYLKKSPTCGADVACYNSPILDELSSSTAFLVITNQLGASYGCTATLIANDAQEQLILTAEHCFGAGAGPAPYWASAIFDYFPPACGSVAPSVSSLPRVRVDAMVVKDYDADFAILRLESKPSGTRTYMGYNTASAVGEDIAMLGHGGSASQSFIYGIVEYERDGWSTSSSDRSGRTYYITPTFFKPERGHSGSAIVSHLSSGQIRGTLISGSPEPGCGTYVIASTFQSIFYSGACEALKSDVSLCNKPTYTPSSTNNPSPGDSKNYGGGGAVSFLSLFFMFFYLGAKLIKINRKD